MTTDGWSEVISLGMPGDSDAHRRLTIFATEYLAAGNRLCAGLAFERACHAAWGDPPRMGEAFRSALDCYLGASINDSCSFEALAALVKAVKLTGQAYLSRANEEYLRRQRPILTDELAQRIMSCFADSADAESYLVKGAALRIAPDGSVDATLTAYEVDMQAEQGSSDGWTVFLPSAFRLFVEQADYVAARGIAIDFASAFASPGLRGWRCAVLGFTDANGAAAEFRNASAAFAEDIVGDLPRPDGAPFWSGINSQLWSPYFAARACVAEIRASPQRVAELIGSAAAAYRFRDSVWRHPNAIAFGVLIASLNELLTVGAPSDVRKIQQEFRHEIDVLGEEPDFALVDQFVTLAVDSFDGFRGDPARELTTGRLHSALELLKRIPLLEAGVADAVAPVLGQQAISEVLGGQRTWIYRTLESIKDERKLQKVVLRLIQSSLPSYAQILHGPLEYGRDIVVVVRRDNQVVLRMYQLKIGDITTSVWAGARRELEDMFLVPPSAFQLHNPPDTREGVLLCNGHCNPHVQPAMEGWFDEQERDHHRQIRFEHLDDLVGWITRERLIAELRAALQESGVPII